MVSDRTDKEFHLTKKGWVTGTYKYFDVIQGEDIKRPEEAMEEAVVEVVMEVVAEDTGKLKEGLRRRIHVSLLLLSNFC